MDVGRELVARARAIGARSIAVVGTSKNAGKSVTISALAGALTREGGTFAMCSIGRDGEAVDALEGSAKPRFFVRSGTLVATATTLVPRSPALEILAVTPERCALGPIALARVRTPTFVEIAGPPQASALRRIVDALHARAPFVLIDGAVDRIAALHGGDDAIVVAVGANANTLDAAVDAAAALVARLALPPAANAADAVVVSGALTAAVAVEHARVFGRRPLVVEDATRVAFGGRTLLQLLPRLDLRAARALRPIACTIASIGSERAFAPAAFARAVAARTGLPTYDAYAQRVA